MRFHFKNHIESEKIRKLFCDKRLTARGIWYNEIKPTELENLQLQESGLNQMMLV